MIEKLINKCFNFLKTYVDIFELFFVCAIIFIGGIVCVGLIFISSIPVFIIIVAYYVGVGIKCLYNYIKTFSKKFLKKINYPIDK